MRLEENVFLKKLEFHFPQKMLENRNKIERGIVLFDGDCNFCNKTVQYIIKYDREDKICFASQQSKTGIKIMNENNCLDKSLNTIVFIKDKNVFVKADAIIEISQLLTGFPKIIIILKMVPKIVRDNIYGAFSKYRYNIFGKKNECIIPTKEIKSKFID